MFLSYIYFVWPMNNIQWQLKRTFREIDTYCHSSGPNTFDWDYRANVNTVAKIVSWNSYMTRSDVSSTFWCAVVLTILSRPKTLHSFATRGGHFLSKWLGFVPVAPSPLASMPWHQQMRYWLTRPWRTQQMTPLNLNPLEWMTLPF